MASSRKTSAARTRAVRPGAKAGKSARASATSRAKTASKAAHRPAPKRVTATSAKPAKASGKPAPTRAAAKPVAKVAAKSAPKPGAGKSSAAAVPGKGAAVKSAKPVAKTKKEVKKLSDAAAKRVAQTQVRPLGVLPPESMMKSTRPAAMPVARPRPQSPGTRTPQTTGQGASRVTEKDLKEFETRLLEERRKILKEMGHLENTVLKVNQRDSSGDLSGYSFHMADAGTDAMEREKAFMFASKEGRTLMEINEALRRVYRGEYGTCESCSQPISRGRLEAMPMARLCVSCKEKEEKAQRGVQ